MSLPAGTIVDKYTLVRCIGQGGMGAVYEARHSLVGKRCAIKMILPELAGDQEVVQRMLREAQAAAAIGHPNIVDTFDFGVVPDGTCYLVMEYLEGRSLGDLIGERGSLDLDSAVAIVDQVLLALEAAHKAGVVHRDLKPDNIFIARGPRGGEEIKLLDFGISKFQAAGPEDIQLTRTGAVLGTPYYMSPEQADGAREVDHRTDLWAMGVILYEALIGAVPFRGQTYNQVIVQLMMKDPVPPRVARPDLPEALEAVILRALEKDPAKRWATAAELREALRSCLPRLAQPEAPATSAFATSLLDGNGPSTPAAGQVGLGASASPATSKTEMATSKTEMVTSETDMAGEPSALDHTLAPAADLGRESALRSPRPGRSRLVVVAGSVAVLSVIAVIFVFALAGNRGERSSSASPSAATAPSTSPDASVSGTPLIDAGSATAPIVSSLPMRRVADGPSPRTVGLRIELKGLPAGATVKLDGQRTRFPLRLPADGRRHKLQVTARGYHPLTRRFTARNGLGSLTLRLRRRSRSRQAASPMERSMTPPRRDRSLADPYRKRSGPRRPAMRPGDTLSNPY